MAEYTISIDESPSKPDIDALVQNLVSFNDRQAEKENWQPLAIFIRNDKGELVGGLDGYTHWGWLFISHLWVAEALRGQDYGTQLVAQAEKIGVRRNCRHAYVDTFDFQALGFYEKLGYEVFGSLEDFPTSHTRYFLQKRALNPHAP